MFVLIISILSSGVIRGTVGVEAYMWRGGDEGSNGRGTKKEEARMKRGERACREVGMRR